MVKWSWDSNYCDRARPIRAVTIVHREQQKIAQRPQGLPPETGGRKKRESPSYLASFMSGPFEAQAKLKP